MGYGVSASCFRPQAQRTDQMHLFESIRVGCSYRTNETRGAGGTFSINQGGKAGRTHDGTRTGEKRQDIPASETNVDIVES